MGLQTGSYTFDMFTILTPGSVCLSRSDVNRDAEELCGSQKSTFGKFNASFQLKQWIKYFTYLCLCVVKTNNKTANI